MTNSTFSRKDELKKVLDDFLQSRLRPKLEELEKAASKDSNLQLEADKSKRIKQYSSETWIGNAAQRANQLKFATHTLKHANGDAKGSVLLCEPETLPKGDFLSTKDLKALTIDCTGNAAHMDVYAFLMLKFEGKTFFELIESRDPDMLCLLAKERSDAEERITAFKKLKSQDAIPRTHSLAKQLYWLDGDDPGDDSQYQILAPLYSLALANEIHSVIQRNRRAEDEAKKNKTPNEHATITIASYPELAIQKLGGSNPINISKLNAERGGRNNLLASVPPIWHSAQTRPPFYVESIFEMLAKRKALKATVTELRHFLESNPPKNLRTRNERERLVFDIIDYFRFFAISLTELEPGWTTDKRCKLQQSQMLWLDAGRAAIDERFASARKVSDWKQRVSNSFAAWLNSELSQKLDFSDVEYEFWSDMFLDAEID
mgnify:CR=1 FL=1